MISPGPGYPADAGISIPLIREFAADVPILGVCLGHQAIGEAFGGRVIRGRPRCTVRRRTSSTTIARYSPACGRRSVAMRYHSLVVEEQSLPSCLEISASSVDGLIMGLRHRTLPVEGVQFHPESILTVPGKQLIRNFVELCRAYAPMR